MANIKKKLTTPSAGKEKLDQYIAGGDINGAATLGNSSAVSL